jgi:nitroreductase
MSVLDAIYARRAVRAYAPDPVDEETVRALLAAAVRAPTAVHLEPWAFVVVQDRARLARYSERAKQIVLAMTPEAHIRDLVSAPGFNVFYDAGTLLVICARPLGPWGAADCWLAAENLMLAACALGLGTCPIGFAVAMLNTPEIKAELAIPADVVAVAPIIVGVPRGPTPAVTRKDPVILSWCR